jgi:hypothetical protein
MSQPTDRGAGYGVDPDKAKVPKTLALIIGVVYTLIGVLGFFVTGFDNFAAETDEVLLGFEVNPLHNIVHLAVGVAGLVMSRKLAAARTYGWLLAIVYGATFLYGLIAVGNPDINLLSLNQADNFLHLGSALLGLLIALFPVRESSDRARR